MSLTRPVELSVEAVAAIRELLGIVVDHATAPAGARALGAWRLDLAAVMDLDTRITHSWTAEDMAMLTGAPRAVALEIEDVELILAAMALTEVLSADLPWIEAVRWTADFVTGELRSHWSDAEWAGRAAGR